MTTVGLGDAGQALVGVVAIERNLFCRWCGVVRVMLA